MTAAMRTAKTMRIAPSSFRSSATLRQIYMQERKGQWAMISK